MITHCYEEAGENVILSDACDLFEKDLTKLLWNELNAYELMVFNKEKYTFTYEKMQEETFHILVDNLRVIYDELSDLIDEVDAHRDVMVVRIKGHVDDRTNHIVGEAKAFADNPEPRMQKYNIEVTETITDPMSKYAGKVPRPLRLDSTTDSAFSGENPYQDMADRIEQIGQDNLKRMYGTSAKNEVMYDPDHLDNNSDLHKDHQETVMKKIYEGSALAGDPTKNPHLFVAHMTGLGNNEKLMQAGLKKRKLRNIRRRRVKREVRRYGAPHHDHHRYRSEGFI
jgi:hypothetical protein